MSRYAVALGCATIVACGARSSLDVPPPVPPPPECAVDADCAGSSDLCNPVACQHAAEDGVLRCVPLTPVSCDDGDPCTNDICDPATAACSHDPATLDLDGDGHRAPLPGYRPGAPGSCGDDCNDANPNAYPGAVEVCDGVDNDCNGVVDDGATFVPVAGSAMRVSGQLSPSGPAGLAYGGTSYAASYWGSDDGFSVYLSTLAPKGDVIPPGEVRATLVNADATGGGLVWVGDRYGMAWQDRRTGDYEVYFTLLDAEGKKRHADVQLSYAKGFSVNASIAWTGNEFLVAWQDDRSGAFDLYAQRLSVDGDIVGDTVQLTSSTGTGNEAPVVAVGTSTTAVAWAQGDATRHVIRAQIFSMDLAKPLSVSLPLTDGSSESVYPTVVWSGDRYVVAWYDKTATPAAIYGAAFDEKGTILVKPRTLTSPGAFRSRYPSLLPLGDRVLVVYSDDRDQNSGYEIYARMISAQLDSLGAELRVTNAPRDSVFPVAAFGPSGDVGILFRDDRDQGQQNVYFARLSCVAQQ